MRIRYALLGIVATALLAPAAALAGAPNYDCRLDGGHGRLAIDQWRPKVVAVGIGSHATVGGAVADIDQNGASLDFTTALSGTRWRVAIRGDGRSLRMTSPTATLTGRCLFVPGNYILRASDRGGHVLRASPVASAPALGPVRTGAPVWESPDAAAKGRWLPVLVVQRNGLALTAATGWLRQLGPYQARAN